MIENIVVCILGGIFGGGVLALLELFRDWRHKNVQNLQQEEKEETDNDIAEVDLQMKTLDLINQYIDSVKINSDKMMMMSGETIKKLDAVDRNQKEMHKRIKLIETFLNGEFKKFKEEQQ